MWSEPIGKAMSAAIKPGLWELKESFSLSVIRLQIFVLILDNLIISYSLR